MVSGIDPQVLLSESGDVSEVSRIISEGGLQVADWAATRTAATHAAHKSPFVPGLRAPPA